MQRNGRAARMRGSGRGVERSGRVASKPVAPSALYRMARKVEAGPLQNAIPLRGVQRITQCGSLRERYGFFSVGSGPLKEADRTRSRRRPQSEAGQSVTAAPGRVFECARAGE